MNGGGFDLGSISPEALSGAISQISAHPELISAVASALGNSAPEENEKDSSPTSAPPSEPNLSAIISSLSPVMAALGGKHKKDPRDEHRYALLCALKPYLNDERQRVLDHILKIGQLGDILKMIK